MLLDQMNSAAPKGPKEILAHGGRKEKPERPDCKGPKEILARRGP